MPRSILTAHRNSLEASHGEDYPLVFATFSHASIAQPIRVVNDTGTTNGYSNRWIYGGNEYIAFPFEIELLTDNDQPPTGRLSIGNVDRRITEELLALTSPVSVELALIMPSEYDLTTNPRTPLGTVTPIWSASGLTLRDIDGDAIFVSGRIQSLDDTQEPYGLRATQTIVPGVYR